MLTFKILFLSLCTVAVLTTVNGAVEGDVKLLDGPSSYEGRIEIYHNGEWGTVCGDSINPALAMVVCRQLGYTGGDPYRRAKYGVGAKMWLETVSCKGSESKLTACTISMWGNMMCDEKTAAAAKCYPVINAPTVPTVTSAPTVPSVPSVTSAPTVPSGPSVDGEPHFLLTSGDEKLCFNIHGAEGQILDLITDQQNDILVRGSIFEVSVPNIPVSLSYFADIGIVANNQKFIFSRTHFTINGELEYYDDNFDTTVGSVNITRRSSFPLQIIISVSKDIEILVSVSANEKVGKFLGVFLLNGKGLSYSSGGIVGQFLNTDFHVREESANSAKMIFSDNHPDIDVFQIKQYIPSAKTPITCYFYPGIRQGGLIGPIDTYLRDHLVD